MGNIFLPCNSGWQRCLGKYPEVEKSTSECKPSTDEYLNHQENWLNSAWIHKDLHVTWYLCKGKQKQITWSQGLLETIKEQSSDGRSNARSSKLYWGPGLLVFLLTDGWSWFCSASTSSEDRAWRTMHFSNICQVWNSFWKKNKIKSMATIMTQKKYLKSYSLPICYCGTHDDRYKMVKK